MDRNDRKRNQNREFTMQEQPKQKKQRNHEINDSLLMNDTRHSSQYSLSLFISLHFTSSVYSNPDECHGGSIMINEDG